jgi:3-(3-hydroxy-phenyl)propionate hydroxylase
MRALPPQAEHTVVVVGGGPTGLMLAGELTLAGVDVAIVERRPNQELVGSRAGGLHSRTIEVLDQRGIAERFVAQGKKFPVAGFHQFTLDVSDFPTRHNYVLGLWQNHIEHILAEWVAELAVPFYRACDVTGVVQDESGVSVILADGGGLRGRYVVGCDGGRSTVRKAAGIEFPGWDATMSWLIAEVETADEPQWGMRQDAVGLHGIGKLEERAGARVVLTEAQVNVGGEPTLGDVSAALVAVYGTDFGVRNPTWISRFNDTARQAAAYRERRVLLAGDAAHVHPPMGGQGLNIGVQDAVNLGWKLAQVAKGSSCEALLDTYHAERHPIAARVLRNTMAQVALRRSDERTKALGQIVSELLAMDEPRRHLAGMLTGLDVHYDLGSGHPLLGRRMPDLDVFVGDAQVRVFELLHTARPVLLDFGQSLDKSVAPWTDRVRYVRASYAGTWELPVIGPVPVPAAVLIRPDGYVAWAGEAPETALPDALARWFGPPT